MANNMAVMNWTLETYRLDEVERKFGIPCVIHLNEGYYSTTDAEGFSQGDIMSIDSKLVLHKVAANFAKEIKGKHEIKPDTDPEYVQLASSKEILIPLNYKGHLKVVQQIKTYDSVEELARDLPRYARLRSNLAVLTEDNKTLTIHAGTVIELDRIIPGSKFSNGTDTPDRLIIQFDHLQRRAIVALPLNLNGKFITEKDNTEYTIQEAIDRYSLPQYVRFVDDEIKRVYTQDLVEGISNVKKITDTFRLNRLVTQEVLVGHHKPVGDVDDEGRKYKQRSLILLPTDNPEIRDIEVNVLQDATEDDYMNIFLVRNVSRSQEELMDGALYIDFAGYSGIRRFSSKASQVKKPPPLPPKPAKVTQFQARRSKTLPGYNKMPTSPKPYVNLATLPKTKHRSNSDCSNMSTRDDSNVLRASVFDEDDYVKMHSPRKEKWMKELEGGITTMGIRSQSSGDSSSSSDINYQEVDEFKMLPEEAIKKRSSSKKKLPSSPRHRWNSKVNYENIKSVSKPTATVSPTSSVYDTSPVGKKTFLELSTLELADRLNKGGLYEMSELCKKERLNGEFFKNIRKTTLKKNMGLKHLQLDKFLQMRDENWIPS